MTGRGAFLGPLGGLVEFVHYKGSSGSQEAREASFKTTLGGARKAFLEPDLGLREWSVSTAGLGPEEFAGFELLTAGAYGPPPFRWIDHIAQVTNAITPRKSLFQAGVSGGTSGPGGMLTGADGTRHPVSLNASAGTVYFAQDTPVLPGLPVTGSVYATSGAKVHLHIRDAAGAILTNISTTATTAGQRLVLTATAPAGAVSARLAVAASTNPGTVAGVAITWTDKPMPWSKGRGAEKVVIHGISDDVQDADPDSDNGRIVDFSFTVTEVGDGA